MSRKQNSHTPPNDDDDGGDGRLRTHLVQRSRNVREAAKRREPSVEIFNKTAQVSTECFSLTQPDAAHIVDGHKTRMFFNVARWQAYF